MSLVLIDASAWIDYLRMGRGPLSEALERLIEEDRAALCGIAIAEVRQGLRAHEDRNVLDLFEILPFLETTREDFEQAGALLAGLRRHGVTLPVTDALMAGLALRHAIPLLENDKHFATIKKLTVVPWRTA